MPTVFLAEHLPGRDPAGQHGGRRPRKRIHGSAWPWTSVFCGRREFFPAMDRLLDGDDPLNVLFGYTPTGPGATAATACCANSAPAPSAPG